MEELPWIDIDGEYHDGKNFWNQTFVKKSTMNRCLLQWRFVHWAVEQYEMHSASAEDAEKAEEAV